MKIVNYSGEVIIHYQLSINESCHISLELLAKLATILSQTIYQINHKLQKYSSIKITLIKVFNSWVLAEQIEAIALKLIEPQKKLIS